MAALKIQKIGDEVAVVLDEDALKLLGAEVGDMLTLERTPQGVVLAKPERDAIRLGREFIAEYRGTFEDLAR